MSKPAPVPPVQVILPATDDEEDALQTTSGGNGSPMGGCVAEAEPYTLQSAMLPQPHSPLVPGLLPRPSTAARRTRLRLMMRGARELAVMGSISHPNIVQVSRCARGRLRLMQA